MHMFCHQCGKLNNDQASFCKQCGASLKPASGQTAAPAAPGIPTTFPIAVEYAGFWKRFAAYILDIIILNIFSTIAVFVIIVMEYTGNFDIYMALFLLIPVFFVVEWLYFALMESSSKQGTPSKRALRIIVTDLDGKRISFGRATGRFFSKFFSIIIFFIGFIKVAFMGKKQGLHDMIAGTLVIAK